MGEDEQEDEYLVCIDIPLYEITKKIGSKLYKRTDLFFSKIFPKPMEKDEKTPITFFKKMHKVDKKSIEQPLPIFFLNMLKIDGKRSINYFTFFENIP